MASTKRVAVYCRVSTTDQHAENQLAELREHAKRMGWETTEFVDEGHSGRKVSRPAFDQMMQAVRRHHYDVVCVWRLDRLSRGLRHAVNVLGELKDLSVEFISLRDGLNFGGPLGLALYALVAALAEAEVEALRERTRAGIAAARRRGKRIGRPPPAASRCASFSGGACASIRLPSAWASAAPTSAGRSTRRRYASRPPEPFPKTALTTYANIGIMNP